MYSSLHCPESLNCLNYHGYSEIASLDQFKVEFFKALYIFHAENK